MDRGQSVVEYIIIIGIAIMALYAMAPALRRGVQTVVKATADQLAPQSASDQDFSSDSSHLDRSVMNVNTAVSRNRQETLYSVRTASSETTATTTNATTNSGFIQ